MITVTLPELLRLGASECHMVAALALLIVRAAGSPNTEAARDCEIIARHLHLIAEALDELDVANAAGRVPS